MAVEVTCGGGEDTGCGGRDNLHLRKRKHLVVALETTGG